MIKLLTLPLAAIFLLGCTQTTEENSTAVKEKPKMANQVVSQVENKPIAASKASSLQSTNKAQIDQQAVAKEALKVLRSEIALIEANNSCDSSRQCQVIEAGSRACGGPSHYMIYSTKHTPTSRAEQVAKKLTKYESIYNAQNNMVSICAMLVKPGTQCKNNKCVKLSESSQLAY